MDRTCRAGDCIHWPVAHPSVTGSGAHLQPAQAGIRKTPRRPHRTRANFKRNEAHNGMRGTISTALAEFTFNQPLGKQLSDVASSLLTCLDCPERAETPPRPFARLPQFPSSQRRFRPPRRRSRLDCLPMCLAGPSRGPSQPRRRGHVQLAIEFTH